MRLSSSIFIAALSLVSASNVEVLTSDTFEEFIEANPLVMVEFYAPWCGHCKALEPEYEQAADNLLDKNIRLAKIDCTDDQDLCMEYDVSGYPTLNVFKGLDSVVRYESGRNAEDIQRFMISRSRPPVVPLTSESEVEAFAKENEVFVLARFSDDKTNKSLSAVAESYRDRIPFASISDNSKSDALAATYKLSETPGLVVVKTGEETVVYEGDLLDSAAIAEFLRVESFPAFGELGPRTYPNYVDSKIPIMFAFVETLEQRAQVMDWIKPHLAQLKGKANVAFLNTTLWGAHAQSLNIESEFPALVVHDIVSNKKYPHAQGEPIDASSIAEYVKNFVAGKIAAVLKSDPEPETQEGSVFVVVGNTYDKVVLDDDRDVLLEIYAPWCGHCKNLAPVYEQLGEIFADDDSIVIAKLDHTTNEIPDRIQGYPTLKFYPAGRKDEAITYEGARSLQHLADFVRENASKGTKDAKAKDAKAKDTKDTKAKKASKKAAEAVENKAEVDHEEL